MKKCKFIYTFLLIIGLTTSSAHASIVYTIDRTIGAGAVKGTITTDGTLGELSEESIIDWSLYLFDGTGGLTLSGCCLYYRNRLFSPMLGLIATNGALIVNPNQTDNYISFKQDEEWINGPYWYLGYKPDGSGEELVYAGPDMYEAGDWFEVYEERVQIVDRPEGLILGTAISHIPEPGSLALLALGIAVVAGTRKVCR